MLNNGISIAINDKEKLLEGVPLSLRLEVLNLVNNMEHMGNDWLNHALNGDFVRAHATAVANMKNEALLSQSQHTASAWVNLANDQSENIENQTEETKRVFAALIQILVAKSGLPITVAV